MGVMDGLLSMARPVSLVPAVPATHRCPVLAWNAISHCAPPPLGEVMLGLVLLSIPRPRSRVPALPAIHRSPVLAWNATSKPPLGWDVMLGLVLLSIPRP